MDLEMRLKIRKIYIDMLGEENTMSLMQSEELEKEVGLILSSIPLDTAIVFLGESTIIQMFILLGMAAERMNSNKDFSSSFPAVPDAFIRAFEKNK